MPDRAVLSDQGVCPREPEFRAAQRARVILQFTEVGCQPTHEAADGWARIDGSWLHWISDDDECWQSWPMQHVICIDWFVAREALNGDTND